MAHETRSLHCCSGCSGCCSGYCCSRFSSTSCALSAPSSRKTVTSTGCAYASSSDGALRRRKGNRSHFPNEEACSIVKLSKPLNCSRWIPSCRRWVVARSRLCASKPGGTSLPTDPFGREAAGTCCPTQTRGGALRSASGISRVPPYRLRLASLELGLQKSVLRRRASQLYTRDSAFHFLTF